MKNELCNFININKTNYSRYKGIRLGRFFIKSPFYIKHKIKKYKICKKIKHLRILNLK